MWRRRNWLVPTGGVFAEAVLGRSNAAELLDATRFWNWQDSPIPLQPPEIAAIELQSASAAHGRDSWSTRATRPEHHEPHFAAGPDRARPMLGALQNGSMFRDMSGLAATVGLAQALGQAMSSSRDARRQTGRAVFAVPRKGTSNRSESRPSSPWLRLHTPSHRGARRTAVASGPLLSTKSHECRPRKASPRPDTSSPSPSGSGTVHRSGSFDQQRPCPACPDLRRPRARGRRTTP